MPDFAFLYIIHVYWGSCVALRSNTAVWHHRIRQYDHPHHHHNLPHVEKLHTEKNEHLGHGATEVVKKEAIEVVTQRKRYVENWLSLTLYARAQVTQRIKKLERRLKKARETKTIKALKLKLRNDRVIKRWLDHKSISRIKDLNRMSRLPVYDKLATDTTRTAAEKKGPREIVGYEKRKKDKQRTAVRVVHCAAQTMAAIGREDHRPVRMALTAYQRYSSAAMNICGANPKSERCTEKVERVGTVADALNILASAYHTPWVPHLEGPARLYHGQGHNENGLFTHGLKQYTIRGFLSFSMDLNKAKEFAMSIPIQKGKHSNNTFDAEPIAILDVPAGKKVPAFAPATLDWNNYAELEIVFGQGTVLQYVESKVKREGWGSYYYKVFKVV